MLAAMPSAVTLQVGESGIVGDVGGTDATTLRLLEMGLVSGTVVTLLKRAPTGDPLQFRIRGFHLSLRRAEAARIQLSESGE
ncbi:MAG: FeoA domain-containing protein [Nannocystaceae bacterium]|nr:FeoA domain-containing protein [Nannocystaceae bacterium]